MMLLSLSAWAAPLHLSGPPDATVEVLPLVERGRVELLVHGAGDLRGLFHDAPWDGVRAGTVTDLGGHHVVTAWMRRSDTTLVVSRVEDGWIATPVPISRVVPGPDLHCTDSPSTALFPLHGADQLLALEDISLDLPRWGTAEPMTPSWERIATLRANLFGADRPSANGLYEMGALHRDLGHLREAAFYFGRAAALGAPTGVASLQRAEALLALGDFDGAELAAEEAGKGGASQRDVLVVLATVALGRLQNDRPPGGATPPVRVDLARALSPHEGPLASLLAGATLLRADCWTEAIVPLTRAAAADGPLAPYSRLLLADAKLLAGNFDGAEEALGRLPETLPDSVRRLSRSRLQLVSVLRQSPDAWPALVPTLERMGNARRADGTGVDHAASDEALEALYLLGQIGTQLGDDDIAIHAFGLLVDRRRRLLDGDPGSRLVGAWARRTGGLLDAKRPVEALAAHVAAWRPGLEHHLRDPAPLVEIASLWRNSALDEEALATLGTVATIEGRQGLDGRETVFAIADTYRRTARTSEALDALAFLATRPRTPEFDGRIALLRGRTLFDGGDPTAARVAWTAIAGPPAAKAEAGLRVALSNAESGACAGVDLLTAASTAPLPEDLSPGRLDAARTACLVQLGRFDEARAAAAVAATTLIDPASIAWARSVAATPDAGAWRRLADEDTADAALRARLGQPAPARAAATAATAATPAPTAAPAAGGT